MRARSLVVLLLLTAAVAAPARAHGPERAVDVVAGTDAFAAYLAVLEGERRVGTLTLLVVDDAAGVSGPGAVTGQPWIVVAVQYYDRPIEERWHSYRFPLDPEAVVRDPDGSSMRIAFEVPAFGAVALRWRANHALVPLQHFGISTQLFNRDGSRHHTWVAEMWLHEAAVGTVEGSAGMFGVSSAVGDGSHYAFAGRLGEGYASSDLSIAL